MDVARNSGFASSWYLDCSYVRDFGSYLLRVS